MFKKLRTFKKTRPYLLVAVGLIVAFAGTAAYMHREMLHAYTLPGPVTAASHGDVLGGFSAHADFEQECEHCHAPVHCVTAERCQDCHMEIARERLQADTLHGRLPGTEDCANCHIEHQGRDARITIMGVANVNHDYLAGFSLSQHELGYDGWPIVCENCHQDRQFTAEAVDCTTCHEQNDPDMLAEHTALYGPDCIACHDGHDRLAEFNHDAVFPLDGAHASLDCAACHADYAYVGTPTDCADCHAQPDIHAARFGLDCARCHSEQAWTPALLVRHNFQLTHGGQTDRECQNCHAQTYAVYDCGECHEHETIIQTHLDVNLLQVPLHDCSGCHATGDMVDGSSDDITERLPSPRLPVQSGK